MDNNSVLFRRSSNAIWRPNPDGSILMLDEASGQAYVLSKNVSRVWMALDQTISKTSMNNSPNLDSGITEKSVAKSQFVDSFFDCLVYLESIGLVETMVIEETDSDSSIQINDSPEGNCCVRTIGATEGGFISGESLLKTVISSIDSSISGDFMVSEIPFGACDCSGGGRGWKRNKQCSQANIKKQNASVVIA